jgi:ribosomal protein S18 acetylase RimI-like enzyme
MELELRPAEENDLAFCESLNRGNMSRYLADRAIAWDPDRFLRSWADFENLIIQLDGQDIGLLRLTPEQQGLGLRDLQVLPAHQNRGIGSWAVRQATSIAASRGFQRLQLRVYEDNPAKRLYTRMGFQTELEAAGTVHMVYELPPNNSFKPRPLRGSA